MKYNFGKLIRIITNKSNLIKYLVYKIYIYIFFFYKEKNLYFLCVNHSVPRRNSLSNPEFGRKSKTW